MAALRPRPVAIPSSSASTPRRPRWMPTTRRWPRRSTRYVVNVSGHRFSGCARRMERGLVGGGAVGGDMTKLHDIGRARMKRSPRVGKALGVAAGGSALPHVWSRGRPPRWSAAACQSRGRAIPAAGSVHRVSPGRQFCAATAPHRRRTIPVYKLWRARHYGPSGNDLDVRRKLTRNLRSARDRPSHCPLTSTAARCNSGLAQQGRRCRDGTARARRSVCALQARGFPQPDAVLSR